MTSIAHAIHDLEEHLTHLKCLPESALVLRQLLVTTNYLFWYKDRLRDLGVDSYEQVDCGCIGRGSNRTSSWPDDIVIIRVGQNAINHFLSFGEHLSIDISQKDLACETHVDSSLNRYKELEANFRDALSHLSHDEALVSRETVTRGYRLDFEGIQL